MMVPVEVALAALLLGIVIGAFVMAYSIRGL